MTGTSSSPATPAIATRSARLLVVLLSLAIASGVALGATAPARRTTSSRATTRTPVKGMARRATPRAVTPGKPVTDAAREARLLEDNGGYARAVEMLRTLRARVPRDGDLELALALDEARAGFLDSARVRLEGPVLTAALVDSMPLGRRHDYPWERDAGWLDGKFGGWHWYVARARAEVYASLGMWFEARDAARAAVAARPLAGKEWLALAITAVRAGYEAEARAAAERAVELDPSLPEAQYVLGLWEWRVGRRADAQSHFRAAVALDSTYREPALALVRSRIVGAVPDTFPNRFLTGIRAVGLLTSHAGPKLEEFVQMEVPATVVNQDLLPLPDSIAHTVPQVNLVLPILVDERGRAVLHDLPWFPASRLPEAAISRLLESLPQWRFTPASRHGRPERVWVATQINYHTP